MYKRDALASAPPALAVQHVAPVGRSAGVAVSSGCARSVRASACAAVAELVVRQHAVGVPMPLARARGEAPDHAWGGRQPRARALSRVVHASWQSGVLARRETSGRGGQVENCDANGLPPPPMPPGLPQRPKLARLVALPPVSYPP